MHRIFIWLNRVTHGRYFSKLERIERRFTPKQWQHTCPLRMAEFGPWQRDEGLDIWEKVGPDRVCSFCGSMHPADFEAALDRIIAEQPSDMAHIEMNDHHNKIYVHRPEIRNASEGGIKFKVAHLPREDAAAIKRIEEKYGQARIISRQRFNLILQGIRANHPGVAGRDVK